MQWTSIHEQGFQTFPIQSRHVWNTLVEARVIVRRALFEFAGLVLLCLRLKLPPRNARSGGSNQSVNWNHTMTSVIETGLINLNQNWIDWTSASSRIVYNQMSVHPALCHQTHLAEPSRQHPPTKSSPKPHWPIISTSSHSMRAQMETLKSPPTRAPAPQRWQLSTNNAKTSKKSCVSVSSSHDVENLEGKKN